MEGNLESYYKSPFVKTSPEVKVQIRSPFGHFDGAYPKSIKVSKIQPNSFCLRILPLDPSRYSYGEVDLVNPNGDTDWQAREPGV